MVEFPAAHIQSKQLCAEECKHRDQQKQCNCSARPNAVLALAREGYRKTDINLRDLTEALTYRGFLRLAGRYWRMGLQEMWRSFSKRAFVHALQRLVPERNLRDAIIALRRDKLAAQEVRDGRRRTGHALALI